MRFVAALFLPAAVLLSSLTPALSDAWMVAESGDTPYLNRAQDLTLVPGGRVVSAGYLGDDSRSWDWFVEMFSRDTGQSLWRDRVDVGSDRAHAVVSTKSDDDRVLTIAVGRIGGKYAVRAYWADTGALAWEDALADIGDAYNADVSKGRINVTGTAVKYDQVLGRQALHIVTRSYVAQSGVLIWERRVVEGDAVRVTETDAIDTGMSRRWYSMVTWVHEAEWSGTMLRVVENDSGQLTFIHRFPSDVTINAVVQRGKVTVVAGEANVGSGKVGRVWAFDARRGRELWTWEPSAAKRVDAESSSVQGLVVKGSRIYVAVNRWIETQCQSGPCRFGERRGTVKSGLVSSGDLHWEVGIDCAIRALAAGRRHVVVAGVDTAQNLTSPTMCGSQLDRELGLPILNYRGLKGDIYAVKTAGMRTFVAGESHEPYPSVVNHFVGALDNSAPEKTAK